MTPHIPPFRKLGIASAVTVALLQMSGQAAAQSAAPAAEPAVQAVIVTGSLIRRVADEGAMPVTTIKASELEARGHTELKDLVLEMPQSLSLGTNSGAAGPVTNLRGLGPMRTLTLLNGRRLANEPLQDQYVSINVMPRMALDRTETLNDGASSIYGADAIGGVLNLWTKRGYKGAAIKLDYNRPEVSGGGVTKSIGAIAGFGDLGSDGYNAYIAVDHQKKSALFQGSRPELFDPELMRETLNGLGLGLLPENRSPSPIANFGFARNSNSNYNPAFATGCVAPYSRATLGATSVNTPPVYQPGCYRDPLYYNAVTDGSEITNISGRASWNLKNGHKLDLEVMHAQFTVQKFRGLQLPGNTAPFTTYSLPSTSRFYPGAGITPAVQVVGPNNGGTNNPAMFIDPTRTPGTVSKLNMNNRPIYFQWGPAELGSAYRNDEQTNDRIVLSAEGDVWGWDYRAGVNYGVSKRDTRAGSGYILYSKAQEGFDKGILNPFGLQDDAGAEYLNSINMRDYTYRLNKAYNQSADLTVSKELWDLGGGAMTLAVSGELRRDAARVGAAPMDLVAKLANGSYAVDASGNITKHDLVGETPSGVEKKLHRDISSLLMEVEAPLTKTFSLNGAVRADHYADLKQTTVNPKLAARWQPLSNLVLRSSLSTGFRAPSIMDIQNPTPEVRNQTMDDPVLCPSRTPTISNTGAPVSGYTFDQVCNVLTNYWTKSPNNTFLKPEKSKGFSFGAVFEPIKNLSISLDYWGLHLRDQLGAVTLAEIQQQPGKYADQIIRNTDGTIDYIIASQANRGETRIRGVDLAASYRIPTTSYGTFDAKLDGTFYDKYEFTSEAGGQWLQNIGILTNDGRFGGAGPNAGLAGMPQIIFRWKHTASFGWRKGPFRAQLSQRYSTGLRDLTPRPGATLNSVKHYSQWNLSTAYIVSKNLSVNFGVNNIADVNPPMVANNLYAGYLTSIADVQGRSYRLSAEYKF